MKIKFLYCVTVLLIFASDAIASDDTVRSKSKLSSPNYGLSSKTQSDESSVPDLKSSRIKQDEEKQEVNDSFVTRVTSNVSSACNPTSLLMAIPIIYYPVAATGYAIPCVIGGVIRYTQSAKQDNVSMTKGKKQQPSDKDKKIEKSPLVKFLKFGKKIDNQVEKLAKMIEKGIQYVTKYSSPSSLPQKKGIDQKIKKQQAIDDDIENKKNQGSKLFGLKDSQDEITLDDNPDQQPIILHLTDDTPKPDLLTIRCKQWTKAILAALFTYGLLKITDKALRSGKLGIVGKKYVHYQNRYDVLRVRVTNKGLSKIVNVLNKCIPSNAHIFYQYPV